MAATRWSRLTMKDTTSSKGKKKMRSRISLVVPVCVLLGAVALVVLVFGASAATTGLVYNATTSLKNATLTTQPKTISVVGYPNAAKVVFSLDGQKVKTDTSSPFTYRLSTTNGSHVLTALVTSRTGGFITNLGARFTVNVSPPVPTPPPPSPSPPQPPPAPTPPPPPPPSPTPPPPPPTGGVWTPAPKTTFQWQLTGNVDTSVNAQAYDIDGFDNSASVVSTLHAQGRKVICYISAGTFENWRPDAAQFTAAVKGGPNGWPGELWLDIRRIDLLGPIMSARMDMCKAKGFDAIEPDNIDGYSNSTGLPLTAQNQITYNTWLADTAHAKGLSIGLKNDIDQIPALQPKFDWALNEQCFQYNECGGYTAFTNAGKAVFITEYNGCPATHNSLFTVILKDINLGAARTVCP